MLPRNKNKSTSRPQKSSLQETPENTGEAENVIAAHEQAEEDIQQDPDLSIHSPNEDLDEAESARLGEGKNDLI